MILKLKLIFTYITIIEKKKTIQNLCKFRKITFECTLGHPVDLSTCRGSQGQAVESHKQQWYQQQHGVRASDLHSTVTTSRQAGDTLNDQKGCRDAGAEARLQCFQVLVVWLFSAILNWLRPPDSLDSLPHCGAGHLSVSLLRGTIGAWSGPWYI